MIPYVVDVTSIDYIKKMDYLASQLSTEFISPEMVIAIITELAKHDFFVLHRSEMAVIN